MYRTHIVLALCLSMATVSTALAVDRAATDLQAQLNWRAVFGGSSRHVKAGYGFAVGYRAALDAPTAQVLQLDINDRAAMARLVGLPLLKRSYSVDENETQTPVAETAPAAGQPWYSQSWVWWTVGGVAAAAALAGSSNQNDTAAASSEGSNVNVLSPDPNQTCGTKGVPPFPDTCVDDPVPLPLVSTPRDPGFASNTAADWLDAGTGRMGDLIAR